MSLHIRKQVTQLFSSCNAREHGANTGQKPLKTPQNEQIKKCLTVLSSGRWFNLRTPLSGLESGLSGFFAQQGIEEIGQNTFRWIWSTRTNFARIILEQIMNLYFSMFSI